MTARPVPSLLLYMLLVLRPGRKYVKEWNDPLHHAEFPKLSMARVDLWFSLRVPVLPTLV